MVLRPFMFWSQVPLLDSSLALSQSPDKPQLSVIKSPSKQYTRHEALRCSWVLYQMSIHDTHLVLCPLPKKHNFLDTQLYPKFLGCSVKQPSYRCWLDILVSVSKEQEWYWPQPSFVRSWSTAQTSTWNLWKSYLSDKTFCKVVFKLIPPICTSFEMC